MTTASSFFSTDMRDPLYEEGMIHFQAGEWQEAIDCFEEVARRYPDNEEVDDLLEEARFKAHLDDTNEVKAKRWIIEWRSLIFRAVFALALIGLAIVGGRMLSQQVAPVLADMRFDQWKTQTLAQANSMLEAGKLEAAEQRYQALLDADPNYQEAQRGLEQVQEQRELRNQYEEAVALQENGEYETALALLTGISSRSPNYRDVTGRINTIKEQQELNRLYTAAEAAYQAGEWSAALQSYQELRSIDVSYQANVVTDRLFELYLALGKDLVNRASTADQIRQALDYFNKALALRPRDDEVVLEQRIAAAYLDGQEAYQQSQWHEAASRLRIVYEQRPDYLGGIVPPLLYDALIRSGDQYRDSGDSFQAYEQYRLAVSLPVDDTTLAQERYIAIQPFLTPTPTPTVTPTPRATAIPTQPLPAEVQRLLATPTPTPTPAQLASFSGRIVFRSDDPEQRGFWVMDPSGENREYLGNSGALQQQYSALMEQEKLSPSGSHRAFVGSEDNGNTQIFIMPPSTEQFPNPQPQQLTYMTHTTYDPAWSPDGDRIAYVSQSRGSDDIWVTDAWLVNTPEEFFPTLLTNNEWEWDKHPSWSPDSERIIFWSNREFRKQIYVMNADGSNVINISNTDWDEYDPLWIK